MQVSNDESDVVFTTRNVYYLQMDKNIKILIQDFNGPCLLIAIVNALILQGKITLQENKYTLSSIVHILQNYNNELPELDGLIYGFDINPCFNDCSNFKDYPAFLKSLNLKMVHSIVCDPKLPAYQKVSNLDYDTFQIKLVELESDDVKDNNNAEYKKDPILEWNDSVKAQTTKYGIKNIHSTLSEHEVAIYFRANHFSVITKHNGKVFCLLTDESFNETEYVWESIPDETGDSLFYDSFFNTLFEGSLENLIESVESLNQSKSHLNQSSQSYLKNSINSTSKLIEKNNLDSSSDMTTATTASDEDEDLGKTNNLVDQQRTAEKANEIENAINNNPFQQQQQQQNPFKFFDDTNRLV